METVGDLLRYWRRARRMSQLELALQAGSSTRHLSFIETGRANPSREMLIALAGALDVPLRERNLLLQAAGFAPIYRETGLDEPEMAQVRHALELLLEQHEPFGAVVLDRRWNIVMANRAYQRFLGMLLGPKLEPRGNVLRDLFAPDRVRPMLANWPEVIAAMLPRVQREAAADRDPELKALLDEILAYPDVADAARQPALASAQKLLIPLEIAAGPLRARLFTTIATLGTPQDITLQELRIESFHAADEATERLAYELAAS
jgi:transcriptional regulator with XRE-family HTH domain